MNKNVDFYQLTCKLQATWKNCFGLYTQYVGYLTPNMIRTLCLIKRETDQQSSWTCSCYNLEEINNKALQMGLEVFSYDKNTENVIPKLWDILGEIDLSSVSEDEWNHYMSFLESKTANMNIQ